MKLSQRRLFVDVGYEKYVVSKFFSKDLAKKRNLEVKRIFILFSFFFLIFQSEEDIDRNVEKFNCADLRFNYTQIKTC